MKRISSFLIALVLIAGLLLPSLTFVGCGSAIEDGYQVSGQVTDKAGEGLPGVSISTSPDFGVAETDEDGFWSLNGLNGTVTLTPTLEGILAFTPFERQVSSEETGADFQVLMTEELAAQIQVTSDSIQYLVEPIWQGEVDSTPEALDDLVAQIEALPNVEWVELDGRFMNVKHVDGFTEMWFVIPYDEPESTLSLYETIQALTPSLSDSQQLAVTGTAALVHPLAVRTEPHRGWEYQQQDVPLLLDEMEQTLEGIGLEVDEKVGNEADIDFYKTLDDYDFIFIYGHGSRDSTMTGESAPNKYRFLGPKWWDISVARDTVRPSKWDYGVFWMVTAKFFETYTSFDSSMILDWGCQSLHNIPPTEGTTAEAVTSAGASAYVGFDDVKWGNVEGAVSLVENLAMGMCLEDAIDALPLDERRQEGEYEGRDVVSNLGFYPAEAGTLKLIVELAVSSTEDGEVADPGEGIFICRRGQEVKLVAEAYEGYRFVKWTGDVDEIWNENSATTTIDMDDDYTITANFWEDFPGGDGTAADPYQITDWYHLDDVRNHLDSHFILMNDLDSTTAGYTEFASSTANDGEGWKPIGNQYNKFTGTFDGQGYEICNVSSLRSNYEYIGLFGELGEGGVIRNVGVVDITVAGYRFVGGLVGSNYFGTVSNSYTTGSVTGDWDVGGLIGYSIDGSVSNSYSASNVIGFVDGGRVGGLLGWNRGDISNCYATGSIVGGDYVGGLVGSSDDGFDSIGTIINCYATGSVVGNEYVGGLVGETYADVIMYCFWDTQSSGTQESAEGIGKTTAEMQNIATFADAEWDIVTVGYGVTNPAYTWNIVNGETYAFLSWEKVEGEEPEPVYFPDPNLEAAIRAAIDKPTGDIYASDLTGLTYLDAFERNILDVTGLEYCTDLTDLDLLYNQIGDITPLSGLTNLGFLELGSNQISDISPLEGLTNLTVLYLYSNQITDISPLEGLTDLTGLSLAFNQIDDLAPLAELTNLTWLALGSNHIVDISPLEDLTNLTLLAIESNEVSNISHLAGLTSLHTLRLMGNQISEIEALVDNPGLGAGDTVYLQNNPLSEDSINIHIPELEARGVTVYYDGGEEAVEFPDPNLEAAIREAIGKPTGDIYPSDLEGLTSLWAAYGDIADLTGLEYCTSLTHLYLYCNQVTDLSPLGNLAGLTYLDLHNNEISNISPLANLASLTRLDLASNQIGNILPVEGLTNLTYLSLEYNQISDISPIEGLTNLTKLYLYSNQISDISPVEGLTNLITLSLYHNQISDISPVGALTNLTELYLSDNQISDISPVEGLTNLTYLQLGYNQISDISPVGGLTNITQLYLYENQISDISPVGALTNLTTLSLYYNQISDISPLTGLTNLTYLSLSHNQISDISPVEGLTNLTYLQLGYNQISDISYLDSLTSLTSIGLSHNQISDVSYLDSLTSLTSIGLSYNQISDVSPLVDNPGLGLGDSVDLRYNPLSDDSINIYIPELEARGVDVDY